MQLYNIDHKYAVLAKRTSLGSQLKFYKHGEWFKYNATGNEGLAEEMVSVLLQASNVDDYVTYEYCEINEHKGCKSKSFLKEGEQIITFAQLYKNVTYGELSNDIMQYPSAKERLVFLIDFMKEHTGLDITSYLYVNLALDYLIKNPDRHFNNLIFILDEHGNFRTGPIFDNGQALMQNFQITPPYMSIEEKEAVITAATVSGSFEEQLLAIEELYDGERLVIDYDALLQTLHEKYPNQNIAKEYLLHSLQQNQKWFDKHEIEQQILD